MTLKSNLTLKEFMHYISVEPLDAELNHNAAVALAARVEELERELEAALKELEARDESNNTDGDDRL